MTQTYQMISCTLSDLLDGYLQDCLYPTGKSWTTYLPFYWDTTSKATRHTFEAKTVLTRPLKRHCYIKPFHETKKQFDWPELWNTTIYLVKLLVNNTFKSWKRHLLKGKKFDVKMWSPCHSMWHFSTKHQPSNRNVTADQQWLGARPGRL